MTSTNCLNCNSHLEAGQKFCSNCSQKVDIHRLSLPEISHDAFHAVTHADKGILHLVKELALKPGIVAKEYIEGKRKKYFNPFSFLVIVTGILVLVTSNFQIFGYSVKDEKVQANVSVNSKLNETNSDSVNVKKAGFIKRSNEFTRFVNDHSNIVLFISTPFLSFFFWIFYRRRKLFYAEHLTSMAFFNSFLMIVTSLVFGPLIYLTRDFDVYGFLLVSMMIFHITYLSVAHKQMFSFAGFQGFLRSLGVSLLVVLCWVIFSMIVGMSYIFWGS